MLPEEGNLETPGMHRVRRGLISPNGSPNLRNVGSSRRDQEMSDPADTFDQMEASLLLCPKCQQATPVRKRLLLVLPEGDKFDYVCTKCGSVSGDKIERPAPGRPAGRDHRERIPLPPIRPRR